MIWRRRERPQIVPYTGGAQLIRPDLWAAIVEDLGGQVQRARGEAALLAPSGSAEAAAGDIGEKAWRVMHPGLSTLLDQTIGGSR